jgi:exportin-1
MTLAATPSLRVDAATKLLDFSQKMDMTLLDQVVDVMNKSTGEMQAQASRILTELKDHPDAWTRVDAILEFSQSMATKYFALQVLEQLIQRRWKVLPRVQCEGLYTN